MQLRAGAEQAILMVRVEGYMEREPNNSNTNHNEYDDDDDDDGRRNQPGGYGVLAGVPPRTPFVEIYTIDSSLADGQRGMQGYYGCFFVNYICRYTK